MSGRTVPLVLILCCPALPLAAQGLQYEGGLSVASGTYFFTERTTTWSLYSGIALDVGPVTLRGSLPVHLQNTTLVSLSGPGGRLPTGGASSGAVADSGLARKRRPGLQPTHAAAANWRVEVPSTAVTGYEAALGDPTVEVGWHVLTRRRSALRLSLITKIPLADTASFGTGKWDLASSVAVSHSVARGGSLGLNLTYWRLGDLSTIEFRDAVYGSGTFTYVGPGGWGGEFTASAATSSLDGYSGPLWVGGSLLRVSRVGFWAVAATVGLSETTPDFTIGLTWKVKVLPF